MRIFCPAIASLRPSLSSFGALLRPPRSGVSRTRHARDPPLLRPGMVIGARSRTEPRHGLRSGAPARSEDLGRTPAASPEQPEYCARDRRRNANRVAPRLIRYHLSAGSGAKQRSAGLRLRALADLV